jgi:Na+/H+ antiporter NhaD/arsenite permease-like protein
MELTILVVFIVGYIGITTEHLLRIDKSAIALLTGVGCWAIYFMGRPGQIEISESSLMHHVQEIASILLFLMGAMTIVELIDAHDGFRIITDRITAKRKSSLLWIICGVTFFMSALLDNLTTAIVMTSLNRKLIDDVKLRHLFGGMVIISANAGGAWSPIGDVTTTMLWITGSISTSGIIGKLLLPSIAGLLIPLLILQFRLKGVISRPTESNAHYMVSSRDRLIVFSTGVAALLMVPVIKQTTHLPPFMGMMFSLGLLWLVTELLHGKKIMEEKSRYSALQALRKIDMPSVLFFLGILLAVASLGEVGYLSALAFQLQENLGSTFQINVAIGIISSIIDNVPLVAAAITMYPVQEVFSADPWLSQFMCDGNFWSLLALTAGTGGSLLIIGSAAGVAVMGMEKISFGWYLRNITPLAIISYAVSCWVYWWML